MAELTAEQKIEELQRQLATAEEKSLKQAETISTLTGQLDEAKSGLKLAKVADLPKEVREDIEKRIGLGVDPSHALEAALRQHDHNVDLKKAVKEDKKAPAK